MLLAAFTATLELSSESSLSVSRAHLHSAHDKAPCCGLSADLASGQLALVSLDFHLKSFNRWTHSLRNQVGMTINLLKYLYFADYSIFPSDYYERSVILLY